MGKTRRQTGVVYEASDSFYVRYFELRDGVRKRVSKFLCDKDPAHPHKKARSVLLLRDREMLGVNSVQVLDKGPVQTPITHFWEHTYLPFITDNLKPSTVRGYRDIWIQFLKDHFTDRTLQAYQTSDGSDFLTDLARKKYGVHTIAHIRSLASGIFTHALQLKGLGLDRNPWSDVKIRGKVKKPTKPPKYSLTELMDIVNNKLKARVDAQLIVCLAGLMGLRPSEIIALTWEDANLRAGKLRVWQNYVRGHLGTTKTDVDETLPLFQPVLGFFRAWHMQAGEPSKGWVFPNTHGDPINIRDYVAGVLKPAIGDGWKSLYAFRRGAASMLTDLTGSPIAASQLLRHINISVTMRNYIQADRTALAEGIQMLESRLALSK